MPKARTHNRTHVKLQVISHLINVLKVPYQGTTSVVPNRAPWKTWALRAAPD